MVYFFCFPASMSPSSWFPCCSGHFVVQFLVLVLSLQSAESRITLMEKNSSISAFFVFGDSTVDSGNNNYIATASKCNFPPYGKDFPNHIPTGRFTNGRLVTDFLASYVGIKDNIPPYLDPKLSLDDFKTGVCFASASSGLDPLTAQLNGVIPIQEQLKYFKEYKSRMVNYIGKERTRNLINKALFLISIGTNDFVLNYYGALPIRRQSYTVSTYQNFILQLATQFIQGLLEMGARRIAFVGLPPIGCVPAVITLYSKNALTDRRCIERLSSIARDYNLLLQNKLAAISTPQSATIIYIDIYKPIDDMIKMPQQFGFDIVDQGCCGSGLLETSLLCNPHTFVCSDDSKYVFWDSIHPTQSAYHYIFQTVRHQADLFSKY